MSLQLNKDETVFVKEMIINQQLSERYLPEKDTLTGSQHTTTEPLVFYGSRKSVYYTDKYIELPNIEEFVYEIIMEAIIINERGKTSFISMRRPDYSYYMPLILMDNIQVDNDEQLLNAFEQN
jgi:hypothetical protein